MGIQWGGLSPLGKCVVYPAGVGASHLLILYMYLFKPYLAISGGAPPNKAWIVTRYVMERNGDAKFS